MSKIGPVEYEWTGEAMRPLRRHLTTLQEHLIEGAVYTLEPAQRSKRSHNHQFAEVHAAWRNLPEDVRERLRVVSADELRKWALCQTRYCTTENIALRSVAEAHAWMRRARRWHGEDYVFCAVHPIDESDPAGECVLVIREPFSQSKKAMGGSQFQDSKDAVLDVLAELLGTTREALERSAKETA